MKMTDKKDTVDSVSQHYNVEWKRPLTKEECEQGFVVIRVDPARIFKTYKLGNHMLEHIIKKALRWTSKGHSAKKVLTEIKACAERELQMMEEDLFTPIDKLEAIARGKVDWTDYRHIKPLIQTGAGGTRACNVKLKNGSVKTNVPYTNLAGFNSSTSLIDENVTHWEF